MKVSPAYFLMQALRWLVHVVLVYCLTGAGAQLAPAPGGRGEVAYKLRAALRAVALAQGLHSLAVGPVQL